MKKTVSTNISLTIGEVEDAVIDYIMKNDIIAEGVDRDNLTVTFDICESEDGEQELHGADVDVAEASKC